MPICTLTPIVRIYEDFDKMSAKEVYYNDSGDKITVQLLHQNASSLVSNVAAPVCDGGESVVEISGIIDKNNARQCTTFNTTNTSSSIVVTTKVNNSLDNKDLNNSQSCGVSSNNNHNTEPEGKIQQKRSNRKLLDSRKRSSSNIHKCSKAFAETHLCNNNSTTSPSPTVNVPQQPYRRTSCGSKPSDDSLRKNSVQHKYLASSPRQYLDSSKMNTAGGLRKHILSRSSPAANTALLDERLLSPGGPPSLCTGYAQYQMSLLEVPMPRDYGDASSDDLSSEWDSDVPERQTSTKVFIIF